MKNTVGLRGNGFAVEVPQGWRVSRSGSGVVARNGGALVSVTMFPLRKPYDQAQFRVAAKALDGVAARLAKAAGATVDKAETVTIDRRKARAYTYGTKRIAFVLVAREEYQLLCVQPSSDACGLLFSSFTLTGPQA